MRDSLMAQKVFTHVPNLSLCMTYLHNFVTVTTIRKKICSARLEMGLGLPAKMAVKHLLWEI